MTSLICFFAHICFRLISAKCRGVSHTPWSARRCNRAKKVFANETSFCDMLSHRRFGSCDAYDSRKRDTTFHRSLKCVHMLWQETLAMVRNASCFSFSSVTISALSNAMADLNSCVRLPSLGPIDGLHLLTALRYTSLYFSFFYDIMCSFGFFFEVSLNFSRSRCLIAARGW